MPPRLAHLRPGLRAGVAFGLAGLVLGISFGVLARPLMGPVAPIVMSALVFAGAAQFGATAVLAAGGDATAAIIAGTLLNARFLPMGVALAPSLTGGPARRAAEGQAIVDASWALAARGGGTLDRDLLLGATIPQYPGWVGGTVIGVFGGEAIGDPAAFGLDAIFPAFFLGLMATELRSSRARAAALGGGAIALLLAPIVPPGLPVLAASAAALIGLRA
ncbi:MAG TPA: AzlC family ABC transporter permease [Thermoleophilaceae bacterium]